MNKYYRKARKAKLTLDNNRRLIFISDIHGDYISFKKLLENIGFSADDYLFILGDFIEKGNENLKTLRYIMELTRKGNVFPLIGNCDDVYERDILNVRNEERFLYYALERGKSVINEMADELNIKITEDTNVKELCQIFTNEYKDLIEFLECLPHVIETDKILMVHAGINNIDDDNAFDFMHVATWTNTFDKYIIAGHNPVINENVRIPSFNPIINKVEKIILIDGGNNVSPYGQLNALIIDNLKNMNMSYTYVDNFPSIFLHNDYSEKKNSINITHNLNSIRIIDKRKNYRICEYLGYILPIFNSDIYFKNLMPYARFGTNYCMEIKAGEELSLLNEGENLMLVKKDGIVSLVRLI